MLKVCRTISLGMCRHLVRGHAISIFNHCLSWYKFADTHLYHSRQWFNIHLFPKSCDKSTAADLIDDDNEDATTDSSCCCGVGGWSAAERRCCRQDRRTSTSPASRPTTWRMRREDETSRPADDCVRPSNSRRHSKPQTHRKRIRNLTSLQKNHGQCTM